MKELLTKINNKWVRLALMVIVGVNTGAMMFGYQLLPFSSQEIATGVSMAAMVGSEIWNHYKNNNYSQAAKYAQNYLESIKGDK
ncbi:phage holin [Halobacillus naozhouensis]|uniref:Phage holin n=1 Tax=Halobacillus naozhouensis TaxID=554880 RepID=A0ABY8J484_9BACI|nr:phage holin [Halobacillus naozhouensis]WFT76254.1 phage holin [Halobacillus naozhouensis]